MWKRHKKQYDLIFLHIQVPFYESQSTLTMVTETHTIYCCFTCRTDMLGMTAQQDLAEDLNTLILHKYQLNRNHSHSTQPSVSHARHTESSMC